MSMQETTRVVMEQRVKRLEREVRLFRWAAMALMASASYR